MIVEFGLHNIPLHRLATIVVGAVTDQHDLGTNPAFLLAVSLGQFHIYRSDPKLLDTSTPLCDAFYRWCRETTDDSHDWPVRSNE